MGGMTIKIFVIILVIAGLGAGYHFFSSGNLKSGEIVIGMPNWESASGTAYVLKALLERDFDVAVRIVPASNEEIYRGIANGSIHVHPEGWVPNHINWHDQFADELDRNFESTLATQQLCVDRSLAEAKRYTECR